MAKFARFSQADLQCRSGFVTSSDDSAEREKRFESSHASGGHPSSVERRGQRPSLALAPLRTSVVLTASGVRQSMLS